MKNLWARSGVRSQPGDTIVEVILAVAVISAVLTGAFNVSSSSSRGVRNSQEHTETLNILQAQVEYVRSLALNETSDTHGVFDPNTEVFCINDSAPDAPAIVEIPFPGGVIPAVAGDNFSHYPAACKKGQDSRYHVAIAYDQTSKVFHFSGRWDRLGGGQKNNTDLTYRIYPGSAFGFSTPAPSPSPPPGCGAGSFNDILLIVDASGSMNFPWDATVTRAQKMLQVLHTFIDNTDVTPANNHEAILQFNMDPTLVSGFTGNTAALHTALGGYATAGGTRYTPALQQAPGIFTTSRPGAGKVIIFLSDGVIEDGDTAAAAAAAAQTLKDAGVKIYAVLMMSPAEGTYAEARDGMLGILGNGGTFASAADPSDLDTIMSGLSTVMTCP